MIKCENTCPLGKFDGCCHSCPEFADCKDACSEDFKKCGCSTVDEETALETFKSQQLAVLQQIASLVTTKKQIEAQEKELKDKLKEAMEQYGVKKFESDILNITYVAGTTSTSVDSAKLKKLHPDIATECSKTSKKSAYIKVEVKGGKK